MSVGPGRGAGGRGSGNGRGSGGGLAGSRATVGLDELCGEPVVQCTMPIVDKRNSASRILVVVFIGISG